MKNISAWAIRHPVTPVVLFAVLLLHGRGRPSSACRCTLNPDISFPGVQVLVSQPGASPQEIETQIMQKVEGGGRRHRQHRQHHLARHRGAVARLHRVRHRHADRPRGGGRARCGRQGARRSAAGHRGAYRGTAHRRRPSRSPIFAVSSSALTDEELSWFVDNTISKRLLGIEGVSQVSRGGGVSREIRIELDPARMQALGVTAAQVNQQLRSLNLDSPGGRAQVGGGEQAIRVLGEARSARDLGDTQIMLPGGRFARLVGPRHRQGQRGRDPLAGAPQRTSRDHLQHLQGQGHLRHHRDERGGRRNSPRSARRTRRSRSRRSSLPSTTPTPPITQR